MDFEATLKNEHMNGIALHIYINYLKINASGGIFFILNTVII